MNKLKPCKMHWHDDVARHLGTARKLARELADALGEPGGEGPC